MNIIDCKKIADEFNEIIRERIDEVKHFGSVPKISFIVGNDDGVDSKIINDRCLFAEQMGVAYEIHKLNQDAKESEVAELIDKLNRDNSVHAISLQYHLPRKLSFRNLVNLINVDKDVEGMTTLNQGRLFSGDPGIIPCVPLGVLHLLRSVHEHLEGMHAVVIGRSSVVGRPLTQLLLNVNCTVTLLHSYSRDLPKICKDADILISAVGSPDFIDAGCVKSGAAIVDVGLNEVIENGEKKIKGDVDFDSIKELTGTITSVGGVEPIGLSYLIHNTLKLACCY